MTSNLMRWTGLPAAALALLGCAALGGCDLIIGLGDRKPAETTGEMSTSASGGAGGQGGATTSTGGSAGQGGKGGQAGQAGQAGQGGQGGQGGGAAVCGNGKVDAGEDCDDGDGDDADGCAPTCLKSAAVMWTDQSYTASAGDVPGPERGFYWEVDPVTGFGFEELPAQGLTLGFVYVELDQYAGKPLDAAFLDAMNDGFATVRVNKAKVVLRFAYNRDVAGQDAPKAMILGHISQLAPVFAQNADVIAALQAGFIGAYGEWHDSTNGLDTPSARKEILDALLAAVPASIAVQVRRPFFKGEALPGGPLTEAAAWDGSAKARTGHHNDCFLAAFNDAGTFDPDPAMWTAYLTADSAFVPVGGETCGLNAPRTDCFNAPKELAQYHWSYLNAGYSGEVLDAWKAGGCYEEIKAHLGYRLVLKKAQWTGAVRPGGAVGVDVDLENQGYAAPFNARGARLFLDSGATRYDAALPKVDVRPWLPGAPIHLHAWARVPADAPPGTYRLGLWLPDAAATLKDEPAYAIRFANDGTWDAKTGVNLLTTTIVVSAMGPGGIDPGASAFEVIP